MMRDKIDDYIIPEKHKQRLKKLEKALLSLKGCSKIEWSLDHFIELNEVIFLVKYDLDVTIENYFKPQIKLQESVIETAKKFDLHKTPDRIEDYGRHYYFVFSAGKTWRMLNKNEQQN